MDGGILSQDEINALLGGMAADAPAADASTDAPADATAEDSVPAAAGHEALL